MNSENIKIEQRCIYNIYIYQFIIFPGFLVFIMMKEFKKGWDGGGAM